MAQNVMVNRTEASNVRGRSLLANTSRVEAPFVKVTIGDYTFGVYEKKNGKIKYPNFIQSLQVEKINGAVNTYTLQITYPTPYGSDPNFFEKIFGSVAQSRNITFSYGDSMQPNFFYKDEKAIITSVNTAVDIAGNKLNYTVKATSTSTLALAGCHSFPAAYGKPSEKIMEVLMDTTYRLTDVFTGMKDRSIAASMIAGDDLPVQMNSQINISALDYIAYLVSCMTPNSTDKTSATAGNVYSITTYEDTDGTHDGPYFKVEKIERASNVLNQLCTYSIDIGAPTANVVTNFSLSKSDNWSIYYDYNRDISSSDYKETINNNGETVMEYCPMLTNTQSQFTDSDRTWWTKVTEFPVTATITLKGLLKPAILMTYVKLNVWLASHKHISSGYYIITKQTDNIGVSGYSTTLALTKIAGDEWMA